MYIAVCLQSASVVNDELEPAYILGKQIFSSLSDKPMLLNKGSTILQLQNMSAAKFWYEACF